MTTTSSTGQQLPESALHVDSTTGSVDGDGDAVNGESTTAVMKTMPLLVRYVKI